MRINDFKIGCFYAKYEFSTPYRLSSSDAERACLSKQDIFRIPRIQDS